VHHPFDLTVFYSTSTTPYMVNLQRFLLSLLPVIGDRPAPVFLAPAFAAAVSDDGGFEKIEVMWRVLLIFLDGIFAQKTLIYIAADTL
jgi:hypothetical protein